ncbi:acetate kinase [Gottschalkiaceae bacterium SANA]|nr:acetate kinase [Gottschalkiaceae bacterium SANA]
MKVLVINCGSSSLKYQLIDMTDQTVLAKGLGERIGIEGAIVTHETPGKEKHIVQKPMETHKEALEVVLESIVDPSVGAISSLKEIDAVGHRVVHGGEEFASSVMITDAVIAAMEKCSELAPLHNPANLIGIHACMELMPGVPMVGVFDTAYHQTMDKATFLYALPYELYETHKIRRYGFHGTSHKYVAERAADMMGKSLEDLKLITCHLGNGASVAAISGGKVVDTSMGFTPLEGLVMGTRCGDMDPAIVTFLMEKENMSIAEVNSLMNKQSGVLGISGVSSDFRDIEAAAAEGNERAELALAKFYLRVRKYIGAYLVVMGGVDGIVFTAGLGENSKIARAEICKDLAGLGIEIDDVRNDMRGKEAFIQKEDASVALMCIPTNEELMIAKDTLLLIKG